MLKGGGGSVIFTSTFVGYTCSFPGVAAYAASKSGPGRPDPGAGRRIRAAGPARQRDPAGRRRYADVPRDERQRASQAFITNLHALKRVATPEELARSVLYLACDDSSFTTGTAMLVDGGASITRT